MSHFDRFDLPKSTPRAHSTFGTIELRVEEKPGQDLGSPEAPDESNTFTYGGRKGDLGRTGCREICTDAALP